MKVRIALNDVIPPFDLDMAPPVVFQALCFLKGTPAFLFFQF
jgi:hypothetical protein